uniref:ADSL_C domain-containing protein n=1 Tax=Trichuris muris TaxID=70415 RepID=A0A5S6QN90_TRIMR
MRLTLHGVDRQVAHEKIRCLALAAYKEREQTGKSVDLSRLMIEDVFFESIWPQLDELLKMDHQVGLCGRQVDEFVRTKLDPIFEHPTTVSLPKLNSTFNVLYFIVEFCRADWTH